MTTIFLNKYQSLALIALAGVGAKHIFDKAVKLHKLKKNGALAVPLLGRTDGGRDVIDLVTDGVLYSNDIIKAKLDHKSSEEVKVLAQGSERLLAIQDPQWFGAYRNQLEYIVEYANERLRPEPEPSLTEVLGAELTETLGELETSEDVESINVEELSHNVVRRLLDSVTGGR